MRTKGDNSAADVRTNASIVPLAAPIAVWFGKPTDAATDEKRTTEEVEELALAVVVNAGVAAFTASAALVKLTLYVST